MVDISPKCVKCGKSLDINSMRTLPDGSFMCLECYEQKTKGFSSNNTASKQSSQKPRRRPSEATDTVASQESVFKEKAYICNDCGYKFRRNSDFVVSVCPYCGSSNVQQDIKPSANNLVENE